MPEAPPQPEFYFEWDDEKAELNLSHHGVSFTEACEVFKDPLGVIDYDADHSTQQEKRYTVIGWSGQRLLFVVFTMRQQEQVTRLIHAREASKRMQKYYVEENS